jgi:histidinol-phosphate aminotransferase
MLSREGSLSLSRRAFAKVLGIGGASLLASRSSALAEALAEGPPPTAAPPLLLLHNNENPLGPGPAVLDAVRAALGSGGPTGRYPFGPVSGLHKAIAEALGIAPENVVSGCGSTQILRSAVQMFTSPAKPLVVGYPAYEECPSYAELIGTPVRPVPVDRSMRLDLDAMAAASVGAGMVFLDNPANPGATVLSAEAVGAFIDRVLAASPDTVIAIDEAYHDYVTDPSYRSQVTRAAKEPRVLVARTFSKAHGMAGLRVGYAVSHADTIKKLASWEGTNCLNVVGVAAATASIRDAARIDRERARNTEARGFTLDWFSRAGFTATDSQTNFVFVDIRRPAKPFREACREQAVVVARDFPPFEKTHVRISISTLEDMQRATEVFGKVLGVKAKPERRGRRAA